MDMVVAIMYTIAHIRPSADMDPKENDGSNSHSECALVDHGLR